MNHRRPRILLTNDDGVSAEGIYHLWLGLKEHCDLTIIAPTEDRSGSGVAITTLQPLRIEEIKWKETETKAYQVHGTPTDCVKLALNVIYDEPPDLIASGINRGANSGRTIFHSGTVGGIIEGALRGIPGIAFSCDDDERPNFSRAQSYVYPLIQYLLAHPLPAGTFLNVTFPDHPEALKGIRLARQGKSRWIEQIEKVHTSADGNNYWLNGQRGTAQEHEESDVELVKSGYLAVVPIQVDELTDHLQFQTRQPTFNEWMSKHLP
jgi:5'-nucleotidase